MKGVKITRVVLITVIILLVPLVLQLTIGTGVDGQGFNWQLNDFIIMGLLLLVVGIAIELITKINKPVYKYSLIAIILLMFVLVWVELAVGIFGTPFAGS